MKTQQKNVLWIVAVAIVAYVIGAYVGFPFSQNKYSSGDLGGIRKANKQQEQVNSPNDLKLAERFESDSSYRDMMIAGYGTLYAQTKATLETVGTLKAKSANVAELKQYMPALDEVNEVGTQLLTLLDGGLKGLNDVAAKKQVSNLSFTLSQALNMFQIMNSRLSDLDAFANETKQLASQKKLNTEVLNAYSEFMAESAVIAQSCGDRAGMAKAIRAIPAGSAPSAFLAMASDKIIGAIPKNCGKLPIGVVEGQIKAFPMPFALGRTAVTGSVKPTMGRAAGNVNSIQTMGQAASGIVTLMSSALNVSQMGQAAGGVAKYQPLGD